MKARESVGGAGCHAGDLFLNRRFCRIFFTATCARVHRAALTLSARRWCGHLAPSVATSRESLRTPRGSTHLDREEDIRAKKWSHTTPNVPEPTTRTISTVSFFGGFVAPLSAGAAGGSGMARSPPQETRAKDNDRSLMLLVSLAFTTFFKLGLFQIYSP